MATQNLVAKPMLVGLLLWLAPAGSADVLPITPVDDCTGAGDDSHQVSFSARLTNLREIKGFTQDSTSSGIVVDDNGQYQVAGHFEYSTQTDGRHYYVLVGFASGQDVRCEYGGPACPPDDGHLQWLAETTQFAQAGQYAAIRAPPIVPAC